MKYIISGKELNFKRVGFEKKLNKKNMIEIKSLSLYSKGNQTILTINDEKISGVVFISIECIKCQKKEFYMSSARVKTLFRHGWKGNKEDLTLICRSCSCKENAKKIDYSEISRKRVEYWEKNPEKKEEFRNSISKGKLQYANITQKKINKAIEEYNKGASLEIVRDILGSVGKGTAQKILRENGVKTRNFSEARKLYFKNNPDKVLWRTQRFKDYMKEWYKDNTIIREPNKSKKETDFYEEIKKIYPDAIHGEYFNRRQFDVYVNDVYIEFDGVYWHCKKMKNIDIGQMFNLINDKYKNNLIKENKKTLYRIWEDTFLENHTLEEIRNKSYYIIENGIKIRDERREFSDKIVSLEFFNKMIKKYQIDLDKNLIIIRDFIRNFYSFPYPQCKESLEEIKNKISSNECRMSSSIRTGNVFLKSRFKSFYDVKAKKSLSAFEAFNDDDILLEAIKNRLGLNNFGEAWDLTKKTLLTYFVVNYYTASFFNPKLAFMIYKKISQPGDTVLDMSSGFGGRLLGWYSFQENGKYIGFEPNTKTYSELISLKNEMNSNIEIYNQQFEIADIKEKIDVCFSCPPYYDVEKYCDEESQSINKYKTEGEWKKDFLWRSTDKMLTLCDKVYMVVNKNLFSMLAERYSVEIIEYIKNVRSHLNKKAKTENNEYLIRIT